MINNIEPIIEFVIKGEDGEPVFNEQGLPLLVDRPVGARSLTELIAKGKVDNLEVFAEISIKTDQWDWAFNYREYLIQVSNYKPKTSDQWENIEEGLNDPEPKAPTRPPLLSVEEVLRPYRVVILKLKRSQAVEALKVITSTGKTFDADQLSILRLNTAVNKLLLEPDLQKLPWSTDDMPTGQMVDCTREEIFEAFKLATDQFTENWEFKE